MSSTSNATGPLVVVACPLCDAPAVIDAAAATLDCAACAVGIPLADDHAPPTLASAA
jgi:hypothetical protein